MIKSLVATLAILITLHGQPTTFTVGTATAHAAKEPMAS